ANGTRCGASLLLDVPTYRSARRNRVESVRDRRQDRERAPGLAESELRGAALCPLSSRTGHRHRLRAPRPRLAVTCPRGSAAAARGGERGVPPAVSAYSYRHVVRS